MAGPAVATGTSVPFFMDIHGQGSLQGRPGKYSPASARAMQPGAFNIERSSSRSYPYSAYGYSATSSTERKTVRSHGHRGGQTSRSMGTQSADDGDDVFKDRFHERFAQTSGRYAKGAWERCIAAVPEGAEYRPVTDLVTYENVSSRYGPSDVSIEPSQRRSTTPVLPRPGLSAAVVCDRAVRRPLTEAVPSSAVLADAVTQTVCEASAQTVEEEPASLQDRVIKIPWGARPDGSTPVIVPIKEAKAIARCTVKTNRTGTKKGSTARQKKGVKTVGSRQERKPSTEKRVLKDRNSDSWTIPLSPQKLVQPRRKSGKPSRSEPAHLSSQRPRSAHATISIVKPAAQKELAQDLQSAPRCTACGACSTECPHSAAASPVAAVQDSTRVLQPVPKQPCTPLPTAAALSPMSPPQECAPPLPSADLDSPRSLSIDECRSQQPPVSVTVSPCSEYGWYRPPSCQAQSCLALPDLTRSGLGQVHSTQNFSSRRAPAPKASCEVLEDAVLHNPERQDMVSQLERALADLERDVSQRASEISSVAAPAFNSGLDSLAALEAEITDQHRRLADIGVLLPSNRSEPAAVPQEPEHSNLCAAAKSPNDIFGAVSSMLPRSTPSAHWVPSGNGPGQSWPRQNLAGSSSGQLSPSILHSDTQSAISPYCKSQAQNNRPVASSVSGSELQPSSNDASAAIPYLSQAPRSILHSGYSEMSVSGAAQIRRPNSHPGSRPHSSSPDGRFSSVSIEDRLTRMGLSEQISQLVRDISAETDSVCSLPQSTQDSFPWLRGVTTNSDTSSTVTLPPLAPPQPLSSRDCLRPSSASPDALSDCRSSSVPGREHELRSLSASGTVHAPCGTADLKQSAASPSPPSPAYELTFAPAALAQQLRNLPPPSDASSSPTSNPTVAGKTQSEGHLIDDREPPFQLHVRSFSQRDSHTRDSSSTHHTSTTPQHTNSTYPSTTTGPRDSSPDGVTRASSARSASLNPAAGSSCQGHTGRESLTSRSQSPELSIRAPSTHTPEQHKGAVDLSFVSPATDSDQCESSSMTPFTDIADVDSILCTSFWAS